MSRNWCAKWLGSRLIPNALAVVDRVERLARRDEVVRDLGRMHLEPEPDALRVEDVDDRPPALGEVLVAALDLGEVVRRERVEQVPDRRAGEAVHLRDAEPRRRARGVLHPLGRALPHALRLAVAPDLGRQDRAVARVDRVADGLADEVRADRPARSGGCARAAPAARGSSRRRRAPCRPRSGRPSRRARARRSPSAPAFAASSSSGRSAHWPVKSVTGLAIEGDLMTLRIRACCSLPSPSRSRSRRACRSSTSSHRREHQLHRVRPPASASPHSSSASSASTRGRRASRRASRRAATSTSTPTRSRSGTERCRSAPVAATSARSASTHRPSARRCAYDRSVKIGPIRCASATAGVTCRYLTSPRAASMIAREGYVIYRWPAMTTWGIISTADINRKVIPGAQASPKVDLVAVASRDAGARRRVRDASGRSRARTARTRRCSPTPRSRRSTSRCRTRCTASGRSRRSRPASTCSARSRCRATRTRSTPRSTPPTAPGRC